MGGVSQIFPLSSLGEEVPTSHPPLTSSTLILGMSEWVSRLNILLLSCLLWWGDDHHHHGFSYCIMALHGYENFNLHPLPHVKYICIVYMKHNNIGRRLWIVKRLRANTSIMPPFIHHPYIATTTIYCTGDWFCMDELFFHPRNEILEKMLLSIQCSWMIYYIGYFKSKFGIFLCRRNEMRKMVVKSNIQLKTMNDARGGWVFFGTVDFLENTGHSISLWFSHPIYYGKPGKRGEPWEEFFIYFIRFHRWAWMKETMVCCE